jgi:DNA-directed RNA polymerase subunit F
MVIKEERPITLAEVYDSVGDNEKAEGVKKFLKTFIKIDGSKVKELKEELTSLDLIKLKDSHIVKIIDFMPEDTSELNKILVEVSLDEEEINKVLDVVKKY